MSEVLRDATQKSAFENRKSKIEWPIAMPFRGSPVPLQSLMEAEFAGAQLRELARWLGVAPKGNSRVGLMDQVMAALNERMTRIAQSPETLLDGLTPDQAEFARRLLTVRDHELPIPRNVAAAVWSRPFDSSGEGKQSRDADRGLTEMIESLRRRALLFPTHAFLRSSYRDVYYQWLPLNSARVPVIHWELRIENEELTFLNSSFSILHSQFLQSFDIFLNAVLQSGMMLRAPLPAHKQASRLGWLRDWEHDADEAERVLRSRPNWVPDPQTGVTVPLLTPFTSESVTSLENHTGLSAAHIEFLFAIACALQLIEPPGVNAQTGQHANGAFGVRVRSSALEEWLVLSNTQKLRRAWKAWSEEIMAGLEVRNAIASLKASQSFRVMRAIGARDLTPHVLAAEWCALRRYVARVLRGLPAGKWVSWDELSSKLFEFYPDCAWTFATKAEWWFAFAVNGARMNTRRTEEWRASIGKIVEHIIRDSLVWFGAVEARIGVDGALDSFRVTPLGEFLIGAREGELPDDTALAPRTIEPIEWVAGSEHTLRVPPAPERASFVGVVRQAAERGAAPFTYTFTAASIERALTQGVTLDDVAAQFKQMRVTLPKAISEQFKLIARRYGRIRVYESLTVLELTDDFAGKELAASTSLMKHVVYQISPRAFILHDAAVDELVEELQAKGYTPRVK